MLTSKTCFINPFSLCTLAMSLLAVNAGAQETIQTTRALIKVLDSTNVPALKQGVLNQMDVDLGDLVQAGQTIAKIDNENVIGEMKKIELQEAIAERMSRDDTIIKFAQKSLEVRQAELKRTTEANDSIDLAVSDTEVDRLKLLVEQGALEVEKARIDFDVNELTKKLRNVEKNQIENDIKKYDIKSPCDGMVVEVPKQKGEWVEPGDTLIRVVRINTLRVEGQIPVEQASLHLKGAKVNVVAKLSEDEITKTGQIIFVSLEANPGNKKVRVIAEIDNSDLKLRPGLPVEMSIEPPDES